MCSPTIAVAGCAFDLQTARQIYVFRRSADAAVAQQGMDQGYGTAAQIGLPSHQGDHVRGAFSPPAILRANRVVDPRRQSVRGIMIHRMM